MKRGVLLLTFVHSILAQMTFTDNWEKRTILPSFVQGWQRNELMVNTPCWDIASKGLKELEQLHKRQYDIMRTLSKCFNSQHIDSFPKA
ncbi:unnamed protein product [Thelazia callipaeda]|uniref:Secreted protein n=1 Tax=Thelazia callipaeda TaxID=103827 RepID=A0A0N5D2A7_THECL|nr:unnamed protein product [Thelazia callipaeda]